MERDQTLLTHPDDRIGTDRGIVCDPASDAEDADRHRPRARATYRRQAALMPLPAFVSPRPA